MPVSFPLSEPRIMPRFGLLSTRQEAFCRHFVACGNAAEAARRAGYAERSARQSGHALLERSHIVERVRQIRLLWRQTARAEVQILLARLEQVWQAAVAAEAPQLMLRVVRFQAELSGVSREGRCHRPDFWPVPDEDEFGEVAAAAGMAAPGPLAQAVQLGRERAQRALARHAARGARPDRQDAPAKRTPKHTPPGPMRRKRHGCAPRSRSAGGCSTGPPRRRTRTKRTGTVRRSTATRPCGRSPVSARSPTSGTTTRPISTASKPAG